MKYSVWKTSKGDWAVCDGSGPTKVIGEVAMQDGAWIIGQDPTKRRFVTLWEAVKTLVGDSQEPEYHLLARGDELRSILAGPEVLAEVMNDGGWVLVASAKTAADLERRTIQAFPKADSY